MEIHESYGAFHFDSLVHFIYDYGCTLISLNHLDNMNLVDGIYDLYHHIQAIETIELFVFHL